MSETGKKIENADQRQKVKKNKDQVNLNKEVLNRM